MAWPNPFRRRDANTRSCWGYTFQITDDHLTPEQTQPMKHSYDKLGEAALRRLDELSPPPRSALPRQSGKYEKSESESKLDSEPEKKDDPRPDFKPKRDLYVLLRDNAEQDKVLGRLWWEVNTVPEWVRIPLTERVVRIRTLMSTR